MIPELQRKILEKLSEGKKTRGQLVIELDSRRTTIYDNLAQLYGRGYIKKGRHKTGEVGNSYSVWEITDEGRAILNG